MRRVPRVLLVNHQMLGCSWGLPQSWEGDFPSLNLDFRRIKKTGSQTSLQGDWKMGGEHCKRLASTRPSA